MKYNKLGETGLLVSELSFGSWVTFSKDGKISMADQAYEIMKVAYEGGVNFFDNAEAYSHGEAESLMGEAIKRGLKEKIWTRESLVVSTKLFFGSMKDEERKDPRIIMNGLGLSRKHIIEGMRGSLKRMDLEYVDLVFCHRADAITNMEEIVRAFNFLIDHGLCFYWGTSEWSSEEIREARGIAEKLGMVGPAFDQPQYHMFHRERVELEYARLYPHVGLTTWSPLASGILTGKYKDGIPEGSRLSLEFFKDTALAEKTKKQIQTTEKLRPIAEKVGATLAQLALAWCIANPDVSTVIGGATSVKQVEENLKAVSLVEKLTPEIMKEIDEVLGNKPELPISVSLPLRIRQTQHIANFKPVHRM